jgi:hypothetical protein
MDPTTSFYIRRWFGPTVEELQEFQSYFHTTYIEESQAEGRSVAEAESSYSSYLIRVSEKYQLELTTIAEILEEFRQNEHLMRFGFQGEGRPPKMMTLPEEIELKDTLDNTASNFTWDVLLVLLVVDENDTMFNDLWKNLKFPL